MHYVLTYEKTADHATKQVPFQADHLAHVLAAVERGELVLAGNLADPADGAAMMLFECESAAIPESFAQSDPYVSHGIVSNWRVRSWDAILGKYAATPVAD